MSQHSVPRHHVDSTLVASVGYDRETSVLEVEFRNGSVYRYFMVGPGSYERLLGAESIGAFFNREIRPKHRFTRLG